MYGKEFAAALAERTGLNGNLVFRTLSQHSGVRRLLPSRQIGTGEGTQLQDDGPAPAASIRACLPHQQESEIIYQRAAAEQTGGLSADLAGGGEGTLGERQPADGSEMKWQGNRRQ